ncbi:hypothetical protein [Thalassotalea hakodatensis]|uniref:hypothetical protein n=1 Tax=Thalassotalea hakodatensis TaxID=3030492 RepID=UPI0025739C4F|nr:hypothetical protein [Thalassotalea hakodatensis]
MLNKINLIFIKSYPLGITIILPLAITYHLNVSSEVLFYIAFCLFFGYQQRRQLNKEIKILKEEVDALKKSGEGSA